MIECETRMVRVDIAIAVPPPDKSYRSPCCLILLDHNKIGMIETCTCNLEGGGFESLILFYSLVHIPFSANPAPLARTRSTALHFYAIIFINKRCVYYKLLFQ